MKRIAVMTAIALGSLPLLVAFGLGAQTTVADWPQHLGPGRDGAYRGPALADNWGSGGPKVVWTKPVGQGFSGPVVAEGRLILFHRVGNREVIQSLDARTGADQWSYGYPTSYRDDFGFDEGPRAVPVVANGIVYTFGAEGQLHAVSLTTGTRLWSEDTAGRFKVGKGFFGAAGSPLVEDGKVIANVGGKGAGIVAFEAKTGKVVWTATDDDASYSSGVAATIARQAVRDLPDARGTRRARPGDRDRAISAGVARTAERVGECRDATRGGRSDLRLRRVRTGCGCASARGDDADGAVDLE